MKNYPKSLSYTTDCNLKVNIKKLQVTCKNTFKIFLSIRFFKLFESQTAANFSILNRLSIVQKIF